MIKFNLTYSINNGQGTIVFKDLGNGSVEATYEIKGNKVPGIITGKVEKENLKSTFQVGTAKGLMNFTFTENGFISNWKKGLEDGPMKGKWEGQLLEANNSTASTVKVEEKKVTIEPYQEELSEKALELKKLEETLLQKQKELEAKEVELSKKVAAPVVSEPTQIIAPPKPKRVFKIVTVKITNTTKMKSGYNESSSNLSNKRLPRIGDSDYYTMKYEIFKENYKLTKTVLLDVFSQGYIGVEDKYTIIKIYKGDTLIDKGDFHEAICNTKEKLSGSSFSYAYDKPDIEIYYSFKISIISIE
jgi:hypothetical protein